MGASGLRYEVVTRNLALYEQLKNFLENEELGVVVKLESPESTFGKSFYLLCIDIETLGCDVDKFLRKVRRLSDVPIILISPGDQTDDGKLKGKYHYLGQVKQPLEKENLVGVTSHLLISYVNRIERKSNWNSYLIKHGQIEV